MNKEYYKKWYYDNWQKRRDYLKEKVICECGIEITRGAKGAHMKSKKHVKKNTDDDLEIIKYDPKEKITCECGVETSRRHISEHKKTKNHIKIVEKTI